MYRVARTRELAEEGKTHREIAEEIGVDHKTVGNVLGKMEVNSKIPQASRRRGTKARAA